MKAQRQPSAGSIQPPASSETLAPMPKLEV
jgi:hypothetical protein